VPPAENTEKTTSYDTVITRDCHSEDNGLLGAADLSERLTLPEYHFCREPAQASLWPPLLYYIATLNRMLNIRFLPAMSSSECNSSEH
jgi:hypothetical protein